MKAIHIKTALEVLRAGQPVDLRVWKKSGEIIEYKSVICFSYNGQTGLAKVKSTISKQMRAFLIIQMFEINNLEIYL